MAINFSRAFKDISLSFVKNPITNDILVLRNEDAIKKSVINLVRTYLGERFFNSLIGTSLNKSLFELFSGEISETIREEIVTLMENFEPRINVREVLTNVDESEYTLNVTMIYDIVGLPFPTQSVDFLLQPNRI